MWPFLWYVLLLLLLFAESARDTRGFGLADTFVYVTPNTNHMSHPIQTTTHSLTHLLLDTPLALYNIFIKLGSYSIHPVLGGVVLQFVAALLGSGTIDTSNDTVRPIARRTTRTVLSSDHYHSNSYHHN
jgi:hypothetical protein